MKKYVPYIALHGVDLGLADIFLRSLRWHRSVHKMVVFGSEACRSSLSSLPDRAFQKKKKNQTERLGTDFRFADPKA